MATGFSQGMAAGTDIPLENLDYGYIGECSDAKEVEKLVQILRSGKEGTFPDLVRFAEAKLRELDPGSQFLIKEKGKTVLRDLPEVEQEKLRNDMESWTQQMQTEESTLSEGSTIHCNGGREGEGEWEEEGGSLPPIRKAGVIGDKSKPSRSSHKPSLSAKSSQRIASGDFKSWERYDADAEASKVDEESEEGEGEGEGRGRVTVVRGELTETEKGMSRVEKGKLAVREKEKGNESFRSGDLAEALAYYTRSLLLSPTVAAYNNRALMYIKLGEPESALADCAKVLELDSGNSKALFRQATARMHLKQYREAANDFEHVLQLDPTNKKAQDHLNTLRSKHLKDDAGKGTRKGNRLHIVEVEGCQGEEEGEESEGEQQKRMLQGLLKTLEKKRSEAREKGKEEEREKGKEEEREKEREEEREKGREGEKKKKKKKSKGKGVRLGGEEVAKQNGKTEERGKEERGEGGTQATVVNGIPKNNGVSEETDSTGVQQVAENPLSKTTKMAETETTAGEPDRPTDEEGGASRQKTPPTIIQAPPTVIQAPPPLPPDVQQAKEEGNQLFRGGQYNSASLKYSLAIHNLERAGGEHDPSLATLLNNRAACFLKTGECNNCIRDCTHSLSLQPLNNVKALLRRGSAYEMKEKYREAYLDFYLSLLVDTSIELARTATTRIARHLQSMDGLDWRKELPPHPDAERVLATQRVLIPDDASLTPPDAQQTPPTQVDAEKTPPMQVDAEQTSPMQVDAEKTPPTQVDTEQTPPVTPADAQQTPPTQVDAEKTPPVQVDAEQTSPMQVDAEKTPPTQVDTEQTPPVTPADAQQTPPTQVDAEKTPPVQVDAEQTSPMQVDAENTPPTQVDTEQTPPPQVDSKKTSPMQDDAEKTPPTHVDAEQIQVDTERTQVDTEQTPATPNDVETPLTPNDPPQTPMTTTDSNQTPGDSFETPDDSSELTDDPSMTPGDSSKTPGDSAEMTDDPSMTPGDSSKTPETQADAAKTTVTPETSEDTTESEVTPPDATPTPEDATETPDDTETSDKLYDEYKSKGNRHVKRDEYTEAMLWYTKCIEICPDKAAAYNNRAFCQLKIKKPGAAEKDCSHALELDPDNIKALYRRGVARKELGNYKDAIKDLRALVQLDPANAAGTKELETVKELWGRQLRGLQSKKVPKETKSGQKGTKKAPSPTSARGPTSTRGQVNTSGHATTKASTTRPKSATRGQTSTKSTTKGSGKKSTQNEAKKSSSSGKGKDKNTAERVTPAVPTRKSAVESLLATREGSGGSEGERGGPGAGASSEGARPDLLTASKTRYFKKKEKKENGSPPSDGRRKRVPITVVDESSDEESEEEGKKEGEGRRAGEEGKDDRSKGKEGGKRREGRRWRKENGEAKVGGQRDSSEDARADEVTDSSKDSTASSSPPVLRLTSYEFVHRWNSIPRSARSEDYAELLELIPLQQLPEIVTNKLDGTMLTNIIRAIDEQFMPRGMCKLSADLLYHLSRVQRFSVVAMFLSSEEKQGLSKVLETLAKQAELQLAPGVVEHIRKSYGLSH